MNNLSYCKHIAFIKKGLGPIGIRYIIFSRNLFEKEKLWLRPRLSPGHATI
jgi:hypothetical protein